MKSIQTLPKIVGYGTLQFVFLSFITLGVFPFIWLFNVQKNFFKEFDKVVWDPIFPVLLPAITGLFYMLSNAAMTFNLPLLSMLFDLTDALMLVGLWMYWALKMRSEIIMYVAKNYHFKLRINIVLLFLFSHMYIVYVINKLPRDHELMSALTQNSN